MSPSPFPDSGSPSFSPTDSVDANSFASIFSTKSENMGSLIASPSTMSPEQSSFAESLLSKLSGGPSAQSTTLDIRTSSTSTSTSTSNSTPTAGATTSGNAAPMTTSQTSAATSTGSNSVSTSTTTNASSAANSNQSNLQKESNNTMSSPGMQAAVAVPVVLVVIAVVALLFFCMRRRKKKAAARTDESIEKGPPGIAKKNKKWTRHLRVFSFDNELLIGGRYSSTNSIRSRQTGSLRSGARSQHSGSPSIHSVDEVAPPYRDAISAAQPPNIGSIMAAAAAGGVAATAVNRSASTSTAPPPYGTAAGRSGRPTSPASAQASRAPHNPFSDNSPVSPVEASPFNDPPGTSPAVSRHSSIYRNERDDASTIGGVSDAASIREATLARNASVMSGGRVIDNVNSSSH